LVRHVAAAVEQFRLGEVSAYELAEVFLQFSRAARSVVDDVPLGPGSGELSWLRSVDSAHQSSARYPHATSAPTGVAAAMR
jgi:hypothetical protein